MSRYHERGLYGESSGIVAGSSGDAWQRARVDRQELPGVGRVPCRGHCFAGLRPMARPLRTFDPEGALR